MKTASTGFQGKIGFFSGIVRKETRTSLPRTVLTILSFQTSILRKYWESNFILVEITEMSIKFLGSFLVYPKGVFQTLLNVGCLHNKYNIPSNIVQHKLRALSQTGKGIKQVAHSFQYPPWDSLNFYLLRHFRKKKNEVPVQQMHSKAIKVFAASISETLQSVH